MDVREIIKDVLQILAYGAAATYYLGKILKNTFKRN
jgi:hypothetical protein